MHSSQATKIVSAIATSGTTVTGSFDTKGFSYATFIYSGAVAGTAWTGIKVEHSDTNSSFEAIPGIVVGTDYSVASGTNSVAVTQPKFVIGFSTLGRKRYLKFTGGAVSGAHVINCLLTNAADAPSSATEQGVTNAVFLA